MTDVLLAKGKAIKQIRDATGWGYQKINDTIIELKALGQIRIEPDGGDTRRKLIRRSDVERIIAALPPKDLATSE